MSQIETLFSGNYIERMAELRTDSDALRNALSDDATRFVAVWEELCFAHESGPALLSHRELRAFSLSEDRFVFLGRQDERLVFAVRLDGDEPPTLAADGNFASLRTISNTLDADSLGLIAYARAMLNWQHGHRYCGVCGGANEAVDGGFVLVCRNPACAQRVFPRLDPAIIVLVSRGDRCLLGRQASWPEGRFSTIAGFVEPGESLEDAVRREVREETDIVVGGCRYFASQPWPFPSSLMIGFHAEATSESINLNDNELAEARWVTRADVRDSTVILPPRMSVAYKLIEAWFDDYDGPALASLGVAAPQLKVAPGKR